MGFYAGVHHRLCIARLVALVVPEPAKSDKVEYDILIEFAAVIERDLNDAKCGFGVVAIDVKDRRLRDLGGVGRIDRTAAELRRRRKSDLIIDNKMDRAAGAIAGKICKLQAFPSRRPGRQRPRRHEAAAARI